MKLTLQLLKELEASATPGPWLNAQINVKTEDSKGMYASWGNEDATLIVEMRNQLPVIIGRIEELELVCDKFQEENEYYSQGILELEAENHKLRAVADAAREQENIMQKEGCSKNWGKSYYRLVEALATLDKEDV